MAKEGYKAPWYFYWATKSNGGKYIKNGKTNYYGGDYLSGNGAKLTGTSKADDIYNEGDKVTINGGAGNDTIYNWGDAQMTSINAGTGNDSIVNGGDKVTIDGGVGNDDIFNWDIAQTVSINAGDDDDTILNNGGAYVTISAGDGSDSIRNYGSNGSLNGGAGNDFIDNLSYKVTVDGGVGNDDIYNEGDKVTINAGSGADTIHNYGRWDGSQYLSSNISINAGEGNNSISTSGEKVTILGGKDKDTIENSGSNVKINAGEGNNSISNSGKKVTILAGDDKDTIENSGSNVTINAGEGNNSISTSGEKVTILSGNGADTIHNYGRGDGLSSNVSINTGNGNNSISNSGEKVTISGGADNDTIDNHGSNVSINGGDGNNLISLTGGKDISIKGGKDTETFIIEAYNNLTASIQSGEGKNVIKFTGSWEGYGGNFLSVSGGVNEVSYIQTTNNTLITGAGDDSVTISSDYNSIIAGTYDISADGLDADYILVKSGKDNTIDTGYGKDIVWIKDAATNNTIHTGHQDDSIRSEGAYNSINTGYGNDTIDNWGKFVTIKAGDQETTGGKNSVKNHVDNVTILGGNESDTITNYMGRGVSINGGAGKDVINLYSIEAFGNILKATFQPLLNAVKDFNQTKINEIIDMYNTLAEYIDGFEKISQVEATYKGKNQIELRDDLKKISEKAGELDDALDEVEDSFKAVGFDTDAISLLKKSVGKVKKIAGKGIKLTDNTEIVTGMVNEYTDNKIWSTFAKEFASDFQRNEKGRLVFPQKKTLSEPTTVRGGKGNDKIYGDEKRFYVYEYKAGDGHDTIFNWNSNDTLSITGGSYTGKIVKGDYVVTVGKGSVTFKNYTSRSIQQVLVGDSFEKLPCQIEGQMLSGGSGNDWHEASGSYWQTVEPPPEGISVDRNELTVAKNFSGEINLSKDYATYITKVDASNAAGNVEIIGSDSTEKITAGKGNDNVHSNRSFTVIHSGAGKDIVSSSGDNNSINSGADNDIIVNLGDSVTVDSGAGNDSIISDGKKNLFIVADGGNKIIYGFGKTDTLQIVDDSGTYSKKKKGDDLIITADDGKITLAGAASLKSVHIEVSVTSGRNINTNESNAVLLGTNKADTIYNSGAGVSISALGGNDSIENNGDNVTISGDKGNDFVDSWGVGTAYVYSAGNDTLKGFDVDDTIVLGSVKINSSLRADGTVTLKLSNKKNLTLLNYWSDKINTVKAVKDVKAINVVRNSDSSVNVKGSSADDYIENHSEKVSISALGGNDSICNNADNVTISGGKGNDSINSWNANVLFKYSDGDGFDRIEGFNETSTLQIGGGSGTYSTQQSGNDLIVTVGKGKITLVDMVNWDNLNIKGKEKTSTTNDGADYIKNNSVKKTISSGKGNDTIKNWADNVTIDAGANDDNIENNRNNVSINSGSGNDVIENSGFNVTILGSKGNDTVWNSEAGMVYVYKSGEGNDYISGFGILETLVVDGAKYSTVKSGYDVLVKVGKNTITLEGATGLANVNVVSSTKNITPVNVVENSTEKKTIKGKSSSNWIRNYASNVTINGGKNADDIYNNGSNVVIKGGGGYDQIRSYSSNVSILGGSKADLIYSYGSDNTVNAGKGNDTIYTGGNVQLIYANGDGKDIIKTSNGLHGGNLTVNLTSGTLGTTSVSDAGDIVINVGKGSLTFKNAQGDKISVKDSKGKTTVVNAGRTATENTKNSKTINKTKGNQYISNSGSKVKITTSSGSDGIENYGSQVTINSAAGNDNIHNEGNNVSINTGESNDYIENYGNQTTILGGKGNDTISAWSSKNALIKYTSGDGNDMVWNFNETSTLQISGGYYSTQKSGDNIIVTVGKGNVTLTNVANLSKLNIKGNKGLIITDSIKSPVTADSDIKVIDASSRTKAIKITGNALANSISGGTKNDSILGNDGNDKLYGDAGNDIIYGGKGNDSLWGGAGNDSLWGDAGKDTFFYTTNEGTDKIFDYATGDMLKILNVDGSYGSFKSSKYYSGGDLTLTINGGGKIIFEDVASSTKFNINGSSYNISGSKLVKK